MTDRQAVVFYSGGISSFWAAYRYGCDNEGVKTTLLFTDTMSEDDDLYRFLLETRRVLHTVHGFGYKYLADGRSIWEVFRDVRMLGNTRADPCSRILKRELARRWIEEHTEASPDTELVFGFGWDEVHRHERAARNWAPRTVVSPMLKPPYVTKTDMLRVLEEDYGIQPPMLYRKGFSHNNCGGGCVKAGQGHFAHLYRALPEVYAEWEANEQALRDELGDVAILRDRTGGDTTPLTLKDLRQRIEASMPIDLWDVGGCGCFEDDAA